MLNAARRGPKFFQIFLDLLMAKTLSSPGTVLKKLVVWSSRVLRLLNTYAHPNCYKMPLFSPILSQLDPVHKLTRCLFEIWFDVIILSTSRYSTSSPHYSFYVLNIREPLENCGIDIYSVPNFICT